MSKPAFCRIALNARAPESGESHEYLPSHSFDLFWRDSSVSWARILIEEISMSQPTTESKHLLSHTIANWACSLKYEDLSPEAIQAAKLFWFDSIGCALGGSQQEDAKILLKHYRAMSGAEANSRDSSTKKPALSKAEGLGMTNKHDRE